MGLENLQSVFTVGLQEPNSTNVTQFDSSLDNLNSYAPTNMIDLTIPNIAAPAPISLAELAVSNQLTFPILDTLQFFNMGSVGSPSEKLYDTYTYDPRTAKPGTGISKNPYTGTLFDDGLGGVVSFGLHSNEVDITNKKLSEKIELLQQKRDASIFYNQESAKKGSLLPQHQPTHLYAVLHLGAKKADSLYLKAKKEYESSIVVPQNKRRNKKSFNS